MCATYTVLRMELWPFWRRSGAGRDVLSWHPRFALNVWSWFYLEWQPALFAVLLLESCMSSTVSSHISISIFLLEIRLHFLLGKLHVQRFAYEYLTNVLKSCPLSGCKNNILSTSMFFFFWQKTLPALEVVDIRGSFFIKDPLNVVPFGKCTFNFTASYFETLPWPCLIFYNCIRFRIVSRMTSAKCCFLLLFMSSTFVPQVNWNLLFMFQ